MKLCPITYEPIGDASDYSIGGLRLLNRKLSQLQRLQYTAEQQRQEALERAGKISIQGIQLKLSAVLKIKEKRFAIVDRGGRFIIKPPSLDFPALPENEDLSMRLAAAVGIEVPLHGLLYAADGSLSYFIKRFDRDGRQKLPLEDFAQLTGATRETKYDSSMEQVAEVITRYCTFPAIERVKLFERTLFSFLIGNEDMHLKNFSLISREGRVDLSPAYDMVNSTIALRKPKEELALPLHGKKSGITRKDLFSYYASERLQINDHILDEMTARFRNAFPTWIALLEKSFLPPEMKTAYAQVLTERQGRLGLT